MTESPRIAVVVFPGSNDDRDVALALERLGAEAPLVWHTDEELPRGTAAVVLPGGFSYGDYLAWRDRPLLAGHARRWRLLRPRAASCSASATASDPDRSRAAPGRVGWTLSFVAATSRS
jgi:hypothetical protein